MDNFIIRDYTNQDFDKLSELWGELGLNATHRGDNAKIIENSIRLGGKLIVLENPETKELFGSSWMTFDGRRIYLHHIGVREKYQNKGFGKLLTLESIKFGKEKGIGLKLEVHQTNKKAVEIYKKLGFKYLGDYDVYVLRSPDYVFA